MKDSFTAFEQLLFINCCRACMHYFVQIYVFLRIFLSVLNHRRLLSNNLYLSHMFAQDLLPLKLIRIVKIQESEKAFRAKS